MVIPHLMLSFPNPRNSPFTACRSNFSGSNLPTHSSISSCLRLSGLTIVSTTSEFPPPRPRTIFWRTRSLACDANRQLPPFSGLESLFHNELMNPFVPQVILVGGPRSVVRKRDYFTQPEEGGVLDFVVPHVWVGKFHTADVEQIGMLKFPTHRVICVRA